MEPIAICEKNRQQIDQLCKQIKGRIYVVKGYNHLIEVLRVIEGRLLRLGLKVEDFVVTYTSGEDINEVYGYQRWATEVDLICEQGTWTILDARSTKIPYEPINYRLMPKAAIAGLNQ